MNRRNLCGIAVMLMLGGAHDAWSAPREAGRNDAAMAKLQAMVKSVTSERDAAKAENAKLQAEIDQLKKDKAAALAAKDSLSGELAAQRNSASDARSRLDKTELRLRETSDRYAQMQQARNELDKQLTDLKTQFQSSQQQLKTCGEHNVTLLRSANELLERYQQKGTWSGLLQDEPLLQFQSVEVQNIVQEYQDKLSASAYAP